MSHYINATGSAQISAPLQRFAGSQRACAVREQGHVTNVNQRVVCRYEWPRRHDVTRRRASRWQLSRCVPCWLQKGDRQTAPISADAQERPPACVINADDSSPDELIARDCHATGRDQARLRWNGNKADSMNPSRSNDKTRARNADCLRRTPKLRGESGGGASRAVGAIGITLARLVACRAWRFEQSADRPADAVPEKASRVPASAAGDGGRSSSVSDMENAHSVFSAAAHAEK